MADEGPEEQYQVFNLPLQRSSFNFMTPRQSKSNERTHNDTRQRISACRKRLRRTRAMQRALKIEQDEAVIAADKLLSVASMSPDYVESQSVFAEAGVSVSSAPRRFAPEVDRPRRLRAR